jgi:hypothetical protein
LAILKSIDLPTVQEELRVLRSEVTASAGLIKALRDVETQEEPIIETFLGPFVHLANAKLEATEAMLREAHEAIQSMAKFFGEDPKKANVPELIGYINEFVKNYSAELKRQRERQERKRRMTEGTTTTTPTTATPTAATKTTSTPAAGTAGHLPSTTSSSGAYSTPRGAQPQQQHNHHHHHHNDFGFEPIPSYAFPSAHTNDSAHAPSTLRKQQATRTDSYASPSSGRNAFWSDVLGE